MSISLGESLRQKIARLKGFERFEKILPLALQSRRMGLSGKVKFSGLGMPSLAQGKISRFVIPIIGLLPSLLP